MYCKKCHNLIESDICPNCNFNNKKLDDFEETKEIELDDSLLKYKNNNNSKNHKKIFICFLIIIILSSVSFYVIKDSKATPTPTSKNIETTSKVADKVFIFKDIKINYSSEYFGSSTNTIFYKNNHTYNMEIKEIDENTLTNLLKKAYESKTINNIDIKLVENQILFTHNNINYMININKSDDPKINEKLENLLATLSI